MGSLSELDAAHQGFSSAHRRLLAAIATVEADGSWRGNGARNLPTFLAARYQVSYATANRWVREARALRERPNIDRALGDGTFSHEQAQALIKLTEPGDDGAWVDAARFWTIDELQREARRATARELERRNDGRYFSMEHTPDERYVRIRGQLHPEEGALVMKAIDRAVPNDAPWQDVDHHRANGLVALASGAVAGDGDPDRATVVVHVTEDEVAELESGGFVSDQTAARLACDARIETVLHDEAGRTIGIGRASRNVPQWLYRQLRQRDKTCTYPGCTRHRFLHAHHVVEWSRGGRTDIDNLLLVCVPHHQLVHEGRWTLRGPAGPGIDWIRPDGTPYRPRAPDLVRS